MLNVPLDARSRIPLLVMLCVAVVILWWLMGIILASDRGLDLTDEGLYLLSIDAPSETSVWGFPFGWPLRPVFRLLGYDIASLRTFGAVVLAILTGWLGWSAARLSVVTTTGSVTNQQRLSVLIATFSAGACSLLYYSSMLRTPSYNWLNLAGLVGGTACVLTLLLVTTDLHRRVGVTRFILWVLVAGFFAFLCLPAKPSSTVFLWFASVLLLLAAGRYRQAGIWAVTQPAAVVVWLVFAVLTNWWPWDFWGVFSRAMDTPPVVPSLSITYAVREVVMLPASLGAAIVAVPKSDLAILTVGLLLLALPVVAGRPWVPVRVAGLITCGVALLVIAGVPVPALSQAWNPFVWAHLPLALTAFFLFVVAVLVGLQLGRTGHEVRVFGKPLKLTTICVLLGIPIAFAFGSSNGLLAQSAVAASVVMIAGFVALLRVNMTNARVILLAGISVIVMSLSALGIVSGWQYPYRTSPLESAQYPTKIGGRGAQLLLSATESAQISDLRRKAEKLGWRGGLPLIDLTDSWHPGISYAMGARVPDSLMLTIFGYAGSVDVADYNLKRDGRDYPFSAAWILTSSGEDPDPSNSEQISQVELALSRITHKRFPSHYCSVSSGLFSMSRPCHMTKDR